MARHFFMLAAACFVGVLIGRAVPRTASAPPAVSVVVPVALSAAERDSKAELSSARMQLAICMAFRVPAADAVPEAVEAPAVPEAPARAARALAPNIMEIRENRRLLDSYPDAVIVQRTDGTVGVYHAEECPEGGRILARKLPDGQVGWWRPDAGPRDDPAAFFPPEAPEPGPAIGRLPDGTITIGGIPADDSVQRMFGGRRRPTTVP